MPIISFTPADALSGIMLDAGNYSVEIIEIDGPKQSQSQKSVSFFTTFILTHGQYKGKELKVTYNSGVSGTSLLGDMQFSPIADFLKIEAAIKKSKVAVVARPDFDTDLLMHKPLVLGVGVSPKEDGSLGQVVLSYLPAGTDNKLPF